jgi:ligand-binding sensor domain-containing protein
LLSAIGAVCLFFLSGKTLAYDPELWTHYTNQNVVSSIAEGESEIYFGTSGGIRRYHRFRESWLRPITTADGLPDNWIEQMTFDPSTGDLTVRTRTGTARWMSRLESLMPGGFVQLDPIRRIPRFPSVVTPFGYYINGDIVRGPHRNYRINDALVDSWNVLWIATEGLGVGRADLNFNELEFLQSGPFCRNVTALEIDGKDLWLGGQDDFNLYARGISRFDRTSDHWQYYERDAIRRLDDTQVFDILADSTDVWFATNHGVVRYRKSEESWDTYRYSRGGSTRHIRGTTSLARGESRLWLGTGRGLAVLDLRTDTLRAVGGSQAFRIRDLAAGSSFVWAATSKGLFRSPIDDVTWAAVRTHPAASRPILALDTSGDTTWALASAPPTLLVSTNPDSAWRAIRLPEVAGTTRASLSASGERAWIGTEFGVLRLNTRSGNSTRLSRIDGLLDDIVHDVRLDGPNIWIATRQGLSKYRWQDDFRDPED